MNLFSKIWKRWKHCRTEHYPATARGWTDAKNWQYLQWIHTNRKSVIDQCDECDQGMIIRPRRAR